MMGIVGRFVMRLADGSMRNRLRYVERRQDDQCEVSWNHLARIKRLEERLGLSPMPAWKGDEPEDRHDERYRDLTASELRSTVACGFGTSPSEPRPVRVDGDDDEAGKGHD